jgi:hypothetical protein
VHIVGLIVANWLSTVHGMNRIKLIILLLCVLYGVTLEASISSTQNLSFYLTENTFRLHFTDQLVITVRDYSPASRLGGPESISAQCILDLWWTKLTLGQVFLRVLRLSHVSVIPSVRHTHLHVSITRRTNGAKPGNLPNNNAVLGMGEHWIGKYFVSCCYECEHLFKGFRFKFIKINPVALKCV